MAALTSKMRLLDILLFLVQYAFAKQVNPILVNQLTTTFESPVSLNVGSCCQCKFEDTKYINQVCGERNNFITLLQNVIVTRCEISDPCRRLGNPEVSEHERFDYIIVGGGVAGPIIARRLSEKPWKKVLLIEAGPEEPTMTAIPGLAFHSIGTILDWNLKTEPTLPHPTACLETGGYCKWPRGKMMSGTSGMNGMMYVRGHPEIINRWARAGNTGWSYNEVEHYYQRAENPTDPSMLSFSPRILPPGPLKVQYFPYKPQFSDVILKSASELGYNTQMLKEYNLTGFMIAPMLVDNGMRGTTPRAYLRPVHDRKNLRVLINSQVTKVLINEFNKAYGVELVDEKGNVKIIKSYNEVILAAGAIGSPHILLNSGIGPKEQLTKFGIKTIKDLPVGKNLQNHVSIDISMSIKDTSAETLTMQSLNEYLVSKTGALASTGLTQVTAFLESSYAPPGVPDIQIFFDGFSSKCPKTGLPYECTNGVLGNCPKRRTIVARPTVLIPTSRGYLQLRSNNPLDPPLMYPNYFTEEQDVKVLVQGIKKVLNLTTTATMKTWDLRLEPIIHPLCQGYHYASDAYWSCYVRAATGPENHQAGTCKMGPVTDPTAVVSPELRVHGISNLRVADASIFPIVPDANPVPTIVMVAEKASEMIEKSSNLFGF